MFDITGTNLEWAFKKLKTHYFYYHSSNFLKDLIIEFEQRILEGKTSFEEEAERLNFFAKNGLNRFSDYFDYGFKVYPKKNAFELNQNRLLIDSKRVNYFVRTDISIYLVDVLFTLNLIEKMDAFTEKKWIYGGRLDRRLKHSSNILENRYLFQDYKLGYQQWCNIPSNLLSDNIVNNSEITIIRTDISSCFYNAEFNFNSFVRHLGLSENNVSTIMKNVYNLYTYIVKKAKEGKSKIFRKVILPVGFLSSQVILNYLLDEFDQRTMSNKRVVENGYGRYVDDIIIAVQGNLESESFDTIFNDILGNSFVKRENTISLRETSLLPCELFINESKTLVRLLPKNLKPYKPDYWFHDVSFCDFTDVARENSPAQFFKDYTNNDIRNYLYDVFNEPSEDIYNLLTTIPSDTLLNCYSFWNDIFKSFSGDIEKIKTIYEQIEKAINRIEDNGTQQICNSIKRTLLDELRIANDLVTKQPSEMCFFGDLQQEELFDLIKKVDKKEYNFQPMIFTLVELSLYLSFSNIDNPNYQIKDATLEMYGRLNNTSVIEYFNTYSFAFDYSTNKNVIGVTNQVMTPERKENKVKVALGALNMDGLEESDIKEKAPAGYNLDTILKLIRKAGANGTNYLIFPEFALQKEWLLKVLKEARKNKLSLISGVIHYRNPVNVVYNLTLIYDFILGIPLLKIKNYLSPEEKKIIVGPTKGMGCSYFEPKTPYYYVINDGRICFSTMTCYEATNIVDRAVLADRINVLFMPVYNYDTHYFSNIIDSLSRDISCFIVQANSNKMGDSKIRMPVQDYLADKARIKGGLNNYIVIDEIDLQKLQAGNLDHLNKQSAIDLGLVEPELKSDNSDIKPLSAGNHHYK